LTRLCVIGTRNVALSSVGAEYLRRYADTISPLPRCDQDFRTLAFLKLLHEIAGPAPESCQRLDIFGDVKHCRAPKTAPF
jgi:hypothetical protein